MDYRNGLPDFCFVVNKVTRKVVLVKQGENGYFPFYDGALEGEETAQRLNADLGVSPPQASAMYFGSVFGWDKPAADPANYNDDGKVKGDKK